MSGKELAYIHEAFETNWISPIGPNLNAFEQEMCVYSGARHAVALSSGTAALHLALQLVGVKPGDTVLCSSFTFAGSAFPIGYCGATPLFIDSEEQSWNMDPELLARAIERQTANGQPPRACIIVHLYGQSADLDPIMEICGRHGIAVIEDAAESVGAYYRGKHTGTIAPLGVFSFNGNNIMTSSRGGMLVGHDEGLIERARFLSTQARDPAPHYQHTCIGYNYRMSNVVAGIGRGQLAVIDERVQRRREIFDHYRNALADRQGIHFMPEREWGRANRWLTCITIDPATGVTPEQVRLALEKRNIESRPVWKPMHLQPVFADCPACTNGVSERLFETGLCLPSGTAMTEGDLGRVVQCVRGVFGG
jgi:pyridoxal phosphate-dependent aminotransferase EpsN